MTVGTVFLASPVVKTTQEAYPHLKPIHRPDFRGALAPLQPLPPCGAESKGSLHRPVRSAEDVLVMQARQAATQAQPQPITPSMDADSIQRIATLERLVEAMAIQIGLLMDEREASERERQAMRARLDTLDGAAVGGAA
jgi:hypothetical protein